MRIDGNDVEAVDAAARRCVDEIRAGGGPRLIHAVTYRFKGHVSVDPGTYRDPAEVQAALADDPLLRAPAAAGTGRTDADVDAIDAAAQAEIDAPHWPAPKPRPGPRRAAYEDVMNTGAGCGDEFRAAT